MLVYEEHFNMGVSIYISHIQIFTFVARATIFLSVQNPLNNTINTIILKLLPSDGTTLNVTNNSRVYQNKRFHYLKFYL